MRDGIGEPEERLLRVQTVRRGTDIELRVRYEVNRRADCDVYRLLELEEMS